MSELKSSSNWTTAKWEAAYARQQVAYSAFEERTKKGLSLLKEQIRGMGLKGMVERPTLLGDQLDIDAKLGQGTRLTAVIPCHTVREEA